LTLTRLPIVFHSRSEGEWRLIVFVVRGSSPELLEFNSKSREETNMELVIVIAGIILVWKFSSAVDAMAIMTRAKAEVTAEKVIGETVIERTDNFMEHQKLMEGKEAYTHEEIMRAYRVYTK
jgi:hypothetical protein